MPRRTPQREQNLPIRVRQTATETRHIRYPLREISVTACDASLYVPASASRVLLLLLWRFAATRCKRLRRTLVKISYAVWDGNSVCLRFG